MAACSLAAAADRKKTEAHSVVGGTVFREPGFAMPGAEVVLSSSGGDNAAGPHVKSMKTRSDARGEFAFHVPPVEAKYMLHASAKGFQPQEKQAEVTAEERVDVNFILVPESKRER